MTKTLLSSALLAAAVLAAPAYAEPIATGVNLSFGGVNPNTNGQNDSSGQTSARLNASHYNSQGQLRVESGYFIETFDAATGMVAGAGNGTALGGALTSSTGGIQINNGCSFNSYGTLGASNVTVEGGGFAAMKGTIVNQAAAPANDSSCYGVSPAPGQGNQGSMLISYKDLLVGNDYINYFGLYYGSIDAYNDLYFYSDDAGTQLVATVTGKSILDKLNGTAGNQTDDKSNVYVNLDFADSVGFRSFRFVTTNIAVEVDNIVVGRASRPDQEVPEPASLALLGAGLAALGFSRRRQSKKA